MTMQYIGERSLIKKLHLTSNKSVCKVFPEYTGVNVDLILLVSVH